MSHVRDRLIQLKKELEMSKSVLVIDTPVNYKSCIYVRVLAELCIINCRDIKDTSAKPDWCPLRPLPEKNKAPKVASGYELGYEDGWNKCLAEIQGGAD